jgi:hypothetical protein
MPKITIRGTLNAKDMVPVTRYTVWNRSPALKIIFSGGCLLVLFGITFLLLGQAGSAVMPALLGSFFIAFPFVVPMLSINRQLKTLGRVSEEGIYEFDEVHFSIVRPSLQVSMPWSSIHSAVAMKDVFAIFTTKTCFFAVPKRFFSPEQVSSFRSLLEQALSQGGKKLISREPRSSANDQQP